MVALIKQINLDTNTSSEFLEMVGDKMMEINEKGEYDIWKLSKEIKKEWQEEQNLEDAMDKVDEPYNEEQEEMMNF
jgi:hypothetical protein